MIVNIYFTALLYAFSSWHAYQSECMRREYEAANYLHYYRYEADHRYRTAFTLTDSNSQTREPDNDRDDLHWDFSRWWYGCPYPPIVDVFVSGVSLDLAAWNQLQSFQYLESLGIQDCQLDPDAGFSSFRHLQTLETSGTALSLKQVRSIANLTQLEELVLDAASDDWFEHVGRLGNLRVLVVSGSDITDDGIAKLAALKKLHGLGLGEERITSKSTTWISQCQDLEWLCLAGTAVDDECLEQLVGLTKLRVLRLDDTRITDAGLASLAKLPNLEDLWLTNTKVTDAGVRHLMGLKKLRHLDLNGTTITNDSVPVLAGLPLLKPTPYSVKENRFDEDGLKHWQSTRASSPHSREELSQEKSANKKGP